MRHGERGDHAEQVSRVAQADQERGQEQQMIDAGDAEGFRADLEVTVGRSWASAEENKKAEQSIGTLFVVPALYSRFKQ